MSTTACGSTAATSYQYVIYSVLGCLVVVSESLGWAKKLPSNSITEALYLVVKQLVQAGPLPVATSPPLPPLAPPLLAGEPYQANNNV